MRWYAPVDGFSTETVVTVRFAETDAQGIAHNAAYLVWFEVARIAYLARHARGYRHIREQGLEALTIESHVRYLKPVVFDDRLVVHVRCGDVRGARFRYEYVVARDGEVVAGRATRSSTRRRSGRPACPPGSRTRSRGRRLDG